MAVAGTDSVFAAATTATTNTTTAAGGAGGLKRGLKRELCVDAGFFNTQAYVVVDGVARQVVSGTNQPDIRTMVWVSEEGFDPNPDPDLTTFQHLYRHSAIGE